MTTTTLYAQTPLLASPPITGPATAKAQAHLAPLDDDSEIDHVTHLSTQEGHPVLLSFDRGDGRVILCAAPYPFTNAGLKDAGNPPLVFNLVSLAGSPASVWFDEWHHGLRTIDSQAAGPGDWLRRTPVGRAFLLAALVVVLALALQGRRFGRPVPLPQNIVRRAPLEHITAIAHLSRRAGHRADALAHYRMQLKRALGKRYRLSPRLPDVAYVARLAELRPGLDAGALQGLLARLNQKNVTEADLVQLAAQVARWIEEVQ
jgi:hypothetical protein